MNVVEPTYLILEKFFQGTVFIDGQVGQTPFDCADAGSRGAAVVFKWSIVESNFKAQALEGIHAHQHIVAEICHYQKILG